MTTKFCGNCGNALNTSDNFCTQCGKSRDDSNQNLVTSKKDSDKKQDKQITLTLEMDGFELNITEKSEIAKKIAAIMADSEIKGELGEKALWTGKEKSGFMKKPIEHFLTNFRLLSFDPNEPKSVIIPLSYVDVVVMNSHRDSSRTGIGGYTALAKGMGIGGFKSSGQSVTVGDVNFLCQGEHLVTISNVVDPNGFKNFVNQLKKGMNQRLENS